MKKYLAQIILISTILLPLSVGAVATTPTIGGNLSIELEPKNPGSMTFVKATAVSFEAELGSATISWYLNGKLEREGVGQNNFTFQTDKPGQISIIKTVIKTDKKQIEKTILINPADVDIVWEANTYTTPFYKGKALASPSSTIKITAIPSIISNQGTALSPANLTYKWKYNYENLLSGIGKQNAEIKTGSPFTDNVISVVVSDNTGSIVAEKTIKIRPENPNIVFYEDKSIEGTNYNMALDNTYNLSEKESTVRAEPYFFSYPKSATENNLLFSWALNSNGIAPNDGSPKIITLRNETGKNITSELSLSIENTMQVFQSAINKLTIKATSGLGF
ncbi:MAG: hypothetical protein WCO84_03875 [bacterium]